MIAVLLIIAVVWLCAGLRASSHVHAWALDMTPSRIFLYCTTCHAESPGWDLFSLPPGCERSVSKRAA